MFSQYTEYEPEMWKGSIYDLSSASSTAQQSSGILPVLQSLITGAGPVISKYLELQAVKEVAETQRQVATAAQRQILPVTQQVAPATVTLPSLQSNWPILAIIGVGVIVALRGRKKPETIRRRSRRKRS